MRYQLMLLRMTSINTIKDIKIGDKMAEQKDLSLLPLMKTPKSQLTAEQQDKKTGTYQKRYSTYKDKEET